MSNNKNQTKATGGIAPFGYTWQNGSLNVDKTESPIRKLIYELFIKHKRKKTVAKLLNDLGCRTRNGSMFSDTTIDRLLRDTTAKGVRIENDREIKVEAIVSEDLWQRANNFLSQKQTKLPIYLFTNFAHCACGNKMTLQGNNNDRYACPKCKRKILADDLEVIFVSQVGKVEKEVEENWQYLNQKEKRIIIEEILNKITIGATEIQVEFAYQAHSFKTATVSQQNQNGNESPKTDATEVNQPTQIEPLMNEIDAAKFLGISRMTLLRKRNASEIGFYRVGFRVLYSREKHLLPFLKSCEK